jgi:hypothetical protein
MPGAKDQPAGKIQGHHTATVSLPATSIITKHSVLSYADFFQFLKYFFWADWDTSDTGADWLYRTADALLLPIGMRIDMFSFSYSYDYPVARSAVLIKALTK